MLSNTLHRATVTVELSKTKKDLMVKVTDTGRGVAPAQYEEYF
jgi:sensor histidine kinase regulating citrate/malate metabolism